MQAFQDLGFAVATVSYDSVDTLARFAAGGGIGLTLLSDPKSAIIAAFDLLNRDYPAGSHWHGLSLPAVFAIDADGIITHRWTDPDYRWRPEPAAVLKELRLSQ